MAISTGMAILGGLSAAGSLASGFMGSSSASAAGGAAAQAAQNAATTNANIQRDQRMRNRVDMSPYMATGRNAIDMLGQLYGWGHLATEGGDDDWRFMGAFNPEVAAAQQANARKSLLDQANLIATPEVGTPTFNTSWGATPQFSFLNVPTTFEADPGYQWRVSEGNKALDRSASSRGSLYSGGQLKALTDWNQGAASQEYGNWWNRYAQGTGFNNAVGQQSYSNRFGQLQYGNQLLQQDYGNRSGEAWRQYQAKYGAARDVLGDYSRMAGMGQSAATGTAQMNTGISNNIGTGYLTAGLSGGNALMAGADRSTNYLTGGISSGINNLISAGAMGGMFSGGNNPGNFGGWGGSANSPASAHGMSYGGRSPAYRSWV